MQSFPNAKINIGLQVVEKRPDGYHNIETVFYPVNLCDILEFVPVDQAIRKDIQLTVTGLQIEGLQEDNICLKAYHLLKEDYRLPSLLVHLHKIIPVGAGLGGGSSDAAFMLRSLNAYFELKISEDRLCEYASELGSDCAFFIKNKPLLASGRGNIFSEIQIAQEDLKIIIINPGIHVSTTKAYAGVVPKHPEIPLAELIRLPIFEWRNRIQNDFENSVFQTYPEVANIKKQLYELGAIYASMSGSGSSVYGLFDHIPDVKGFFKGMFCWEGAMTFEV